jgi:hypothetical protein
MPPAGFEPTIPVSERPQTHALDSAATGIGTVCTVTSKLAEKPAGFVFLSSLTFKAEKNNGNITVQ